MSDKKNIAILMIEKDREFVRNLANSLSKVNVFSFTLECIDTLKKAFSLDKEKKYSVILLDLFLESSRGLQTLKRVRIHFPDLPIIVLTENDDVELAVSAVRFGAQDYLIKSKIDPHLLSLGIRYAVERKRTEQFQREQLHFLQSVMDNIPSPLYIKDTNLLYSACNLAFEELIGMPKERIIGKSVFDILKGGSSEIIRKKELELISGKNTLIYELQLSHKREADLDMIFHETIHKRSDGSIAGLIGVATDVSKMKKIQKTLKNAKISLERKIADRTKEIRQINNKLRSQIKEREKLEEQLLKERSIFINGPVVVFRCAADSNATVKYISPNIVQYGYTVDDFIKDKLNYTDIIHDDCRKKVVDAIEKCMKSGGENINQYFVLVKKDGTERNVYCYIVIRRNNNGEVSHFDGYISDITDRRDSFI